MKNYIFRSLLVKFMEKNVNRLILSTLMECLMRCESVRVTVMVVLSGSPEPGL